MYVLIFTLLNAYAESIGVRERREGWLLEVLEMHRQPLSLTQSCIHKGQRKENVTSVKVRYDMDDAESISSGVKIVPEQFDFWTM